jgi:hypothetical protein
MYPRQKESSGVADSRAQCDAGASIQERASSIPHAPASVNAGEELVSDNGLSYTSPSEVPDGLVPAYDIAYGGDGLWFPVPLTIFDRVLPAVSANAWRVFCVVLRATLGWRDANSSDPRRRKTWDHIPWSQFMRRTGIRSRSTLSRALQELLDQGFLRRRQATRGGRRLTVRGQPKYEYSLGRGLSLDAGTLWFPVPNAAFDTVMRLLTPNGWRIYCVILRRTLGRRVPSAEIRFDDFMEAAGIGSDATIDRAIQGVLGICVARHAVGIQPGLECSRYAYIACVPATESVPVAATESVPVTRAPATESVLSKQYTERHNKDDDDDHTDSDIHLRYAALRELGVHPGSARRLAVAHSTNEIHHACAVARRRATRNQPGLAVWLLANGVVDESLPEPDTARASVPAARGPLVDAVGEEGGGRGGGGPAEQFWAPILEALSGQLTPATFNFLLANSRGVALDGGRCVVEVRNSHAPEWLAARLAPQVARTARRVSGRAVEIEFVGPDGVACTSR